MSTFTSNFASQIEAMLEWRISLGHVLRDMREDVPPGVDFR
ncbi:MAG: hypothetical protein ACRDYB_13055 [Acidimicrobiales bacterium]